MKNKKPKIHTLELINRILKTKRAIFEVSLNNGVFNATHFIYRSGRMLYDEGIDGKKYKIDTEGFLSLYLGANWIIDQVVYY